MEKDRAKSLIAITALTITSIIAASLLYFTGSLFFLKDRVPVGNAAPETKRYIPEGMQAGVDRCKVHGDILEEDKVRIAYGLTMFDYEAYEAKERLFPNAHTEVGGGCIVPMDPVAHEPRPKNALVLYCQQCRIAEQEFNKSRREKQLPTGATSNKHINRSAAAHLL